MSASMDLSTIVRRLCSFAGAALCAALLAACATFQGIRPGVDTEDAIRARFGAPRMQWADADGSATLVYPFGPLGLETWMVKINPEGRVISAEQVLQMSTGFARIQMGMRGDEVTRILGPHYEQSYFSRRAE
ncbi:MAG: hypothetical protein JNJ60_14225, partial [Rhodocyclaceae bacterium]|nr:hypothetical protein [Rhodocyclaceae bacterium]